jgi:hypothetical protein
MQDIIAEGGKNLGNPSWYPTSGSMENSRIPCVSIYIDEVAAARRRFPDASYTCNKNVSLLPSFFSRRQVCLVPIRTKTINNEKSSVNHKVKQNKKKLKEVI